MQNYNPDVLSCLANLSNDEVFTPPEIANQMLDLLPDELWHDSSATFLDPACKSGVFLREIAKRLIEGLKEEIPDLQERVDHIFKHQLYGIAITELTSLLSRRSLYCSKFPDSKFSVSYFENPAGNIRFQHLNHTWKDGKCIFCGASQSEYDRGEGKESHAYEWIHTKQPEDIFNMKFDVIIGNPPYQMSDGGNGASAKPLYHLFVEQAKKLKPRYLTMIIPARWYSGGKGLDDFRSDMLSDCNIRVLVDYFDSTECFPGVDISGGICYFLWDRDNKGKCQIISNLNGKQTYLERNLIDENADSFIRFNEAISIIHKVNSKNEEFFSSKVSSRKPFGLPTNPADIILHPEKDSVKLYAYPKDGYINRNQISKNIEWIEKYKVCNAKAYGERGTFPYQVLAKPFIAEPNSCCSETYLVLGTYDTKSEAENAISYIQTRMFRFLVLMNKNTQDSPKRVYSLVPQQDFSKPWTDEELYQKYGLTEEEIAFIESMIKPMETD